MKIRDCVSFFVTLGVAYFALADLLQCLALERSTASPFGAFLEEVKLFETVGIILN